jgi:general secretion pathway protein J
MNRATRQSEGGTREGGFTLIELLVSLTILCVILGLLSAGLRVISQNWDANAERIDTLDMVSRAVDILHRDASGLQRVVVTVGKSPRFLFTGTPAHLAFVTLEPPYPSAAGPYFVSYSVVANGQNAELIRARAPYHHNMQTFPGATPANRVPLLQGPYQYQFAYAQKSAQGGTWQGSWPYQNRIPDLIRLQIIDTTRGGPISPPIIVAIPADAELSCLAGKAKLCSAKTGGTLKGSVKSLENDPARKFRSKYRK